MHMDHMSCVMVVAAILIVSEMYLFSICSPPSLSLSFPSNVVPDLSRRSHFTLQGDLHMPSVSEDAALHARALAGYCSSFCSCVQQTPSQHTCHCEYASAAVWFAAGQQRTGTYMSDAVSCLLPAHARSDKCPLLQSLRQVAEQMMMSSSSSSSSLSSLSSSDRISLGLNWTGLHFALASRSPEKFDAAIQCAAQVLGNNNNTTDGGVPEPFQWLRADDASNVGSYSFEDNTDAVAAFTSLMHYACFYGCSGAVRVLSESARAYYRASRGLFADAEYESTAVGLPSCALSLFFSPLNVACTPLDVCVRMGHTDCVKECLDASELFDSAVTSSDGFQPKRHLSLSWPMILSIVTSGIGGDSHCCYVLRALQTRMPLSDLWRALQSPVKTSPLMQRRAAHRAVAGGGESVLHALVRRNWFHSVNAALLVFSSCAEASRRETHPCNLVDGCGVSLLQASIASGHSQTTKLLGPYFSPELEAVAKITLAARKMLIRRYIKKSRRLFALRMMSSNSK